MTHEPEVNESLSKLAEAFGQGLRNVVVRSEPAADETVAAPPAPRPVLPPRPPLEGPEPVLRELDAAWKQEQSQYLARLRAPIKARRAKP
jgi:hypothetical protein